MWGCVWLYVGVHVCFCSTNRCFSLVRNALKCIRVDGRLRPTDQYTNRNRWHAMLFVEYPTVGAVNVSYLCIMMLAISHTAGCCAADWRAVVVRCHVQCEQSHVRAHTCSFCSIYIYIRIYSDCTRVCNTGMTATRMRVFYRWIQIDELFPIFRLYSNYLLILFC